MEEKNYEPYGKEWEQELMKLTKKEIINVFRTINNKPKVNTIKGCELACQGIINDFESGLMTKEQTMLALKYYTFSIHNFFAEKVKDLNLNIENS